MSGPGTRADGTMADWVIPRGTHTFNAPIVMEDQEGVTWRGYGGQKVSRLVYVGPPTKAFIQLIGSKRNRLTDFEIVIASPGVESAVLVCNKNPANPNGRISNSNVFDNIRVMHGGYPTAARDCFAVDSRAMGGTYFNNEQHRFIRCYAQHYTRAGFVINGSQAHQLLYDGCAAHDAGVRLPGAVRYGLLAEDGAYFRWTNGVMTANTTDFKTNSFPQHMIVDNSSSELSGQFFSMGTVGGYAVLSVSNIRWEGYPSSNPTIDCYGPNQIDIRDSWFAGIAGICPTMRCRGTQGPLNMSNVLIRQHLGTVPATPLITVPAGWTHQLFGVKHQRINEDGSRTNSPITVNTAQAV